MLTFELSQPDWQSTQSSISYHSDPLRIAPEDIELMKQLHEHLTDIIDGMTYETYYEHIADLFENVEEIIEEFQPSIYKNIFNGHLHYIMEIMEINDDAVYTARNEIIYMLEDVINFLS